MDKDVLITPIREWVFEDGLEAYKLEQKIIKLFSSKKYTGPNILVSGNTELFSEDILDDIEPLVELTLLMAE